MDDGELELGHLMSSDPEFDQIYDELLRNNTRTCTHTHTCNPPGPAAASHTHTCYHTHTQVFETSDGDDEEIEAPKKARKPLGNREAVRKYREKKKAHTAYLEEEVKKLRLLNQQLLRKLQGQPALEAEVVRLRSLLVGLRWKIDTELGAFPFQKQCNTAGLQCETNGQCFVGNSETVGWERGCLPAVVNCQCNPNGVGVESFVEAVSSMGGVGSLESSDSPALR